MPRVRTLSRNKVSTFAICWFFLLRYLFHIIDEIFTHIRDLTGKVLRSVKISERPREVIRLPSLGEDADSLVDGIGLSPSAILTIHAVLIEVVRDVAYSNRAREFTDRLVGLGMALMEAKLIWNSINKQIFLVPRVTVYRDKLNLGVL